MAVPVRCRAIPDNTSEKRERLTPNGPPGRGPLRRHFGTLFRRHRHTASLNLDEIRRLGPEPLDPRFTFSDFARLFEGRTGRIKALLMNPTFIAGIGNIYSDEILYAARTQPLGRVDQLVEPGLSSLYRCMRDVLRKASDCAARG